MRVWAARLQERLHFRRVQDVVVVGVVLLDELHDVGLGSYVHPVLGDDAYELLVVDHAVVVLVGHGPGPSEDIDHNQRARRLIFLK